MNKYEKYMMSKEVAVPEAPEFVPARLYCYRCALALWREIDPEDTDLAFFTSGRAYTIQPDEPNASFHRDQRPQCGHDI